MELSDFEKAKIAKLYELGWNWGDIRDKSK